jgi:hypothetical protein
VTSSWPTKNWSTTFSHLQAILDLALNLWSDSEITGISLGKKNMISGATFFI